MHAQTNTPTDTGIIRDESLLPGVDLYLDVTVNGNAAGLVHFGYENEKLYASANTLRTLGFRLPEETTQPVGLYDIAQLNVDYNKQLQTLALTVPLNELDLATTQLNPPAETAPMASPRAARCSIMIFTQSRVTPAALIRLANYALLMVQGC